MKRRFVVLAMVVVAVFCFLAMSQIAKGVEPFYNITGLYFRSDEASVGDKLYVDLYMTKQDDSTSVNGYFVNEKDPNYISLPLKDVNTRNPYFEISSYMQAGTTYKMTVLTVSDNAGQITYFLTPGSDNYMNPMGKNVIKIKSKPSITGLELLGGKDVDMNGNLKLELRTNQEVDFATIALQNKSIASSKALVSVDVNKETTIDMSRFKTGSQPLLAGDYSITDVFLNPDDQSTYVHYSLVPQDSITQLLEYKVNFRVTDSKNENSNGASANDFLRSIALRKNEANLNEKVGVDIGANGNVSAATLIFTKDDESMTVNVKGLSDEFAYFVVPFTSGVGDYELSYVILKDENGEKYHYRKGEDYGNVKHFDFDISLNVKNGVAGGELVSLDNSKITSEIIDKIKGLEGNIVIEINADNDPVIVKELFEAIKGSDKTLIITYGENEWIFNGLDVNDPKQIDVNLGLYDVADEEAFTGRVNSGIVLDFPMNGDLPGKCLIKIYDSKFVSNILGKNDVNIYYYDEGLDKFEAIDLGNHYNEDGFYEFYLSHNSMYVMTNDMIDEKFVVSSDSGAQKMPFVVATTVLSFVLVVLLIMIWYNIYRGRRKKNVEKNIGGGAEL